MSGPTPSAILARLKSVIRGWKSGEGSRSRHGRSSAAEALEQNVAGLQVAVEHAPLMGVVDGPGKRGDQAGRVARRHRLAPVAPASPPASVRGNTRRRCRYRADAAGLIHRNDIGVVEPRGGMRLALEPLPRLGSHQGLGLRDLERDLTPQRRVPGEEHDPEAALAQRPQDLEAAEPTGNLGSGCRRSCLRPGTSVGAGSVRRSGFRVVRGATPFRRASGKP